MQAIDDNTKSVNDLLRPLTFQEMIAKLKSEGYTLSMRFSLGMSPESFKTWGGDGIHRFNEVLEMKKKAGVLFKFLFQDEWSGRVVYFFDKEDSIAKT